MTAEIAKERQLGVPQGGPVADRIDGCRARAGLFRLLERCLGDEIDEGFLALMTGPLKLVLTDAEIGFADADELFTGGQEKVLADLSREFNGLFVVPGAVCPYRSVFETGCMFQAPSDEAVAAYREAGLDFRHRYSGEFPDHIAVMMSFVAHLSERECEALETGDDNGADALREQRERFTIEQIGPWGPGWCRRARLLADHGFYRRILEFAERLLWREISQLADRKRMKEIVALNGREPITLDYDADFRKASGL